MQKPNFGQLIRGKIIKTVATRCQILRLKCNKIDFGWESAPDPMDELTALLKPLAEIKDTYFEDKGKCGEEKGMRGGLG